MSACQGVANDADEMRKGGKTGQAKMAEALGIGQMQISWLGAAQGPSPGRLRANLDVEVKAAASRLNRFSRSL